MSSSLQATLEAVRRWRRSSYHALVNEWGEADVIAPYSTRTHPRGNMRRYGGIQVISDENDILVMMICVCIPCHVPKSEVAAGFYEKMCSFRLSDVPTGAVVKVANEYDLWIMINEAVGVTFGLPGMECHKVTIEFTVKLPK